MIEIPKQAPRAWLPWLLAPIIAVLAFGLGRCTPELAEVEDPHAHADEGGAEAAEIWTCSMHPQVQQPGPGLCPLCGMDLIPLGDMPDQGEGRISLSPRAAILARIQTAEVHRIATSGVDLRLLGKVEVDESRVRNVSAWVGGRVDKLFVRETGTVVKQGQTIASLYSPEVYTAHQDLIAAGRQVDKLRNASELARGAAEQTLAAARERLSLLGLSERQIDRMLDDSQPRKSISITTSERGTVMERLVTQGQYVEAGAVLYRIADLSKVWVVLDAYETDLASLMEGQSVELSVEALPGERFQGEIEFIDPLVDPRRRVTRVRVEADNAEGRLRPGMFVEALVGGSGSGSEGDQIKQKPLVVPVTAPLFTGKRSLVYVEVEGTERPTYEPRVVELGPRVGELYPVVAGLSEGERVVIHGAFAIDADLQIRGGESMMSLPDERASTALDLRVTPDPMLRGHLAALVGAYLDMQVALADDAWQPAAKAGARLGEAVEAVDAQLAKANGGPAADAWAQLGPKLAKAAAAAADADAIEGARGAFLELSRVMRSLIGVFGNPLDQPIRLAFCPMANSNAGAEWLQAGEVIDNSYFGESMLSCGEIRTTIEAGQYLLASGDAGVGGE